MQGPARAEPAEPEQRNRAHNAPKKRGGTTMPQGIKSILIEAAPQGTGISSGCCRSQAATRPVRARTLLGADDVAFVENAAAKKGRRAQDVLCVFSRRDEKTAARLDDLVEADCVAERQADGTVLTVPVVVGG